MDTTEAIHVEAEIHELKDQLQAVREELMDDIVEISTIAFVSEVQSHSWMYANCVPADTFHRYYDAVSLLTILTHSGVTISKEMTMDKNAKSGSFVNKEAATFAASFALELPEIFGKETVTNQHRDDRELPAIRTHSEWDSGTGHSGAKNTIMKALSKNVKSIRRHMNRYFSGDAQMVAETMLTDSQAFLTELCNWVSRHHFELITRTESDAATVWSLVAHDVRVIFQLLFEARGPGRNTGEPQHFFWGTLRAHKVMQELRAYNFSGHPQLGHALNQHLQDNAVMKASFHALEKTVESLKRDVALALKTADKAASKK
jgi:cell division protein FtsB